MRFIDYVGEEGVQHLKDKFEELLRSEDGGFIIIHNNETGKVTDAYMLICVDCAARACIDAIEDADKEGLLAEEVDEDEEEDSK